MRAPRWLDRLWLWAIALSFLIVVPGFAIVWINDYGWFNVTLYVLVLVLIGVYRALSAKPQASSDSPAPP